MNRSKTQKGVSTTPLYTYNILLIPISRLELLFFILQSSGNGHSFVHDWLHRCWTIAARKIARIFIANDSQKRKQIGRNELGVTLASSQKRTDELIAENERAMRLWFCQCSLGVFTFFFLSCRSFALLHYRVFFSANIQLQFHNWQQILNIAKQTVAQKPERTWLSAKKQLHHWIKHFE